MSRKGKLTESQEQRRIEGLRILARIIARHYLAHPELYPSPGDDGEASLIDGRNAVDAEAVARDGNHGS